MEAAAEPVFDEWEQNDVEVAGAEGVCTEH